MNVNLETLVKLAVIGRKKISADSEKNGTFWLGDLPTVKQISEVLTVLPEKIQDGFDCFFLAEEMDIEI